MCSGVLVAAHRLPYSVTRLTPVCAVWLRARSGWNSAKHNLHLRMAIFPRAHRGSGGDAPGEVQVPQLVLQKDGTPTAMASADSSLHCPCLSSCRLFHVTRWLSILSRRALFVEARRWLTNAYRLGVRHLGSFAPLTVPYQVGLPHRKSL